MLCLSFVHSVYKISSIFLYVLYASSSVILNQSMSINFTYKAFQQLKCFCIEAKIHSNRFLFIIIYCSEVRYLLDNSWYSFTSPSSSYHSFLKLGLKHYFLERHKLSPLFPKPEDENA